MPSKILHYLSQNIIAKILVCLFFGCITTSGMMAIHIGGTWLLIIGAILISIGVFELWGIITYKDK